MADRERRFVIMVGAPGHGKSTLMQRIINAYKGGDNVLLFKMFLNIDDKAFKDIKHKPFAKYSGGWAKISDNDETIPGRKPLDKYKFFLRQVKEKFRNGLLVVDDASTYERNIISDEFNDLMMMRRHMGVDVFYLFHGLSFLPIQQFPYINYIILFHTTDNFSYKGGKIPAMDRLQAAQQRIAAEVAKGNKYYHEIIKLS